MQHAVIMNSVIENLYGLLAKELETLDKIVEKNQNPVLFIELIRCIDSSFLFNYEGKEKYEPFIQLGYGRCLEAFYKTSIFREDYLLLSPSISEIQNWCFNLLLGYGRCQMILNSLDLVKSGDMYIRENGPGDFHLIVKKESGIEYIENQFVDSYFHLIHDNVFDEENKRLEEKEEYILKQLNKEVEVWREHYIKYGSTPEIDDFYFDKARVYLCSSQLFDDFAEEDCFGQIPYGNFMLVLQAIMGVTLKHIAACELLCTKNHDVSIYNILTLPVIHNDFIEEYVYYLNIKRERLEEIFDVLTVDASNISEHIKASKEFSPLFIKVGNRFTLRSVRGCLRTPIFYLQNELKRRYPKDYFKWINKREDRFRKQLYDLFCCSRFTIVNRNIELNVRGIRTDIDAVIFDKWTKTLGLFQLKWQDKFASDFKARRSRISNMVIKANEWVEKIADWTSGTTPKEILSSLGIEGNGINETYIFVIGRYNTVFSNNKRDERAVWGSWYRVIETVKKMYKVDSPLKVLYEQLKTGRKFEEKPEDLKIEFENFSVSYSCEW